MARGQVAAAQDLKAKGGINVIVLFSKALAIALGVSLGVWAVASFNEYVFAPWVKCCRTSGAPET